MNHRMFILLLLSIVAGIARSGGTRDWAKSIVPGEEKSHSLGSAGHPMPNPSEGIYEPLLIRQESETDQSPRQHPRNNDQRPRTNYQPPRTNDQSVDRLKPVAVKDKYVLSEKFKAALPAAVKLLHKAEREDPKVMTNPFRGKLYDIEVKHACKFAVLVNDGTGKYVIVGDEECAKKIEVKNGEILVLGDPAMASFYGKHVYYPLVSVVQNPYEYNIAILKIDNSAALTMKEWRDQAKKKGNN